MPATLTDTTPEASTPLQSHVATPARGITEHTEAEARRKALAAPTRKVKIKMRQPSEGDAAALRIRAALARVQTSGGHR